MINLVEDLERINQTQVINAQAVRYQYAFALNRFVSFFDISKQITLGLMVL
jgi:hypothetical protein